MTGNQILAGCLAGLGGAIIADHTPDLLRALASRDWVATHGRVVEAAAMRGTVNMAPRGVWYPAGLRITYTYTVDGRRYRGRRSSWHGHAPTLDAAVDMARRYEPGTRVTVWYNPAAPHEAVLERGVGPGNVLGVGLGMALFAVGMTWLLSAGAA
jgi:hypothetical protein